MRVSLFLALVLLQAAPRPPADPFATASPRELGAYRAVIETTKGKITLEFLADKAPETVRNFLRLAAAEVYDNTLVHRVLPNVLIQTGAPYYRQLPLTARQRRLIHNLPPEFNDTRHVRGIVSMARGDAADSATTSFFIVTGTSAALDGVYTAFGRVVDGMAAVEAIEAAPRDGETPRTRIELKTVRIEKK